MKTSFFILGINLFIISGFCFIGTLFSPDKAIIILQLTLTLSVMAICSILISKEIK